ncbi:MAG: hypothetical protein MJ224_06405 [archaeon]|nr:hypothetical protein [archaeon]
MVTIIIIAVICLMAALMVILVSNNVEFSPINVFCVITITISLILIIGTTTSQIQKSTVIKYLNNELIVDTLSIKPDGYILDVKVNKKE